MLLESVRIPAGHIGIVEITISYTQLSTVLAPALGSVVALRESRVRW